MAGFEFQALLGVTGSGKTYTMAKVIERTGRPALIISPNKTLAAQLYEEFKGFFPNNAVGYFVSYYDYYQPEAYIPATDTYIEKDSKINEEIDRLRHEAVQMVLSRRDAIVVASVSCIYNLGSPQTYLRERFIAKPGDPATFEQFFGRLLDLQYERNDYELAPGRFRKRMNLDATRRLSSKALQRLSSKAADACSADIPCSFPSVRCSVAANTRTTAARTSSAGSLLSRRAQGCPAQLEPAWPSAAIAFTRTAARGSPSPAQSASLQCFPSASASPCALSCLAIQRATLA